MTPIYSATIVAFSGAGLYYGFIIKRPLYGASVGFTTGVIPVALGILFGSKAFYLTVGVQLFTFSATIRRENERMSRIVLLPPVRPS